MWSISGRLFRASEDGEINWHENWTVMRSSSWLRMDIILSILIFSSSGRSARSRTMARSSCSRNVMILLAQPPTTCELRVGLSFWRVCCFETWCLWSPHYVGLVCVALCIQLLHVRVMYIHYLHTQACINGAQTWGIRSCWPAWHEQQYQRIIDVRHYPSTSRRWFESLWANRPPGWSTSISGIPRDRVWLWHVERVISSVVFLLDRTRASQIQQEML